MGSGRLPPERGDAVLWGQLPLPLPAASQPEMQERQGRGGSHLSPGLFCLRPGIRNTVGNATVPAQPGATPEAPCASIGVEASKGPSTQAPAGSPLPPAPRTPCLADPLVPAPSAYSDPICPPFTSKAGPAPAQPHGTPTTRAPPPGGRGWLRSSAPTRGGVTPTACSHPVGDFGALTRRLRTRR